MSRLYPLGALYRSNVPPAEISSFGVCANAEIEPSRKNASKPQTVLIYTSLQFSSIEVALEAGNHTLIAQFPSPSSRSADALISDIRPIP
jgi:hypothetical protein